MKNRIKRLEEEIQRVEIELVHDGYHDGWTLKHLKNKLKKLKKELKEQVRYN